MMDSETPLAETSAPPAVEGEPPPTPGLDRPTRRRYLRALTVASALATLALLPFSYALMVQSKNSEIPANLLPLALFLGGLVELAFVVVLAALGLKYGTRIGLGWPPIQGWGEPGEEGRRRRRNALLLGAVAGVLFCLVIDAVAVLMPGKVGNGGSVQLPPWWVNVLASLGAGVREEIMMRLGALSILAWLISRMSRMPGDSPQIFWTANVISTLLFGALHLPQAYALLGLTTSLVVFILVGNGLPGLGLGWIYARKGLIPAMVSHAVMDIVLKVIQPLIEG